MKQQLSILLLFLVAVLSHASKISTADRVQFPPVAKKKLTGANVAGQFKLVTNYIGPVKTDFYVPVAGQNLNVRTAPSLRAKVLFRLKINTQVTVLYRAKRGLRIGGRYGKWAFIRLHSKVGWVFDYFLGYKSKFKRVKKCKYKKIVYSGMNGGYSVLFTKNGFYFHAASFRYSSSFATGKLFSFHKLLLFRDHSGMNRFGVNFPSLAQTSRGLKVYPLRAVMNGEVWRVQQYLRRGGSVNATDEYGNTMLHIASRFGHNRLLSFLIRKGAAVNMTNGRPHSMGDPKENAHETPLHCAARSGGYRTVLLLLRAGAKVNAINARRETPLFKAIEHKRIAIVNLLLRSGAKVDVVSSTVGPDHTPLILAIKVGSTQIVHQLLKKNASVNLCAGYYPFDHALQMGNRIIIKLLLRKGAKTNGGVFGEPIYTDVAGAAIGSLLFHKFQNARYFLALLDKKREKEILMSVLVRAASNNDLLVVSWVKRYLSLKGYLSLKSMHGEQAFFSAVRSFSYKRIYGQGDYNRKSALIRFLIKQGVNINCVDRMGRTPLFYAIKIGKFSLSLVSYFLTHGASVYVKDHAGNTPLHIAVSKHCLAITELLVKKNAEINSINKLGQSPLHLSKLERVSRLLISNGAKINLPDKKGRTPLHMTAALSWRGKQIYPMCKYLLQKGANLHARTKLGETVLHFAAKSSYYKSEVVGLLLNKGAKIDAKDKLGRTPLHLAVLKNQRRKAKLLIYKGADVDAQDKRGRTPLHFVRDTEIARRLIAKGADLDEEDRNKQTPLHYAAKNGHSGIVQLLLAKGVDLDDEDRNKQTPLHYAAKNGHFRIVKLLVLKGAEIGVRDSRNQTPFDLAKRFNHSRIISFFRKRGAK